MSADKSLRQLGKVMEINNVITDREALLIECLRRIGRVVAPTRLEHPDLTTVFGLVGNALLVEPIPPEIAILNTALKAKIQRASGNTKPLIPRAHLREDGFPTRSCLQLMTPAERAITDAMAEVEKAGASLALTDAIVLLGKARDRVADHVEGSDAV